VHELGIKLSDYNVLPSSDDLPQQTIFQIEAVASIKFKETSNSEGTAT